jgi:WD40 repeat protein
LAAAVPARADEPADKPILVLDAGGHTALVRKVLFTPDAREVITVSEDKTIRFWDATTGEALRTLRPPIGSGNEGKLFASALSPDGKLLAVAGFGWRGGPFPIYLLDTATGRIQRLLTGHTSSTAALAFSPDGQLLASGSDDHTARLWNVATGACTQTLAEHTARIHGIAFSPDGRQLATASQDRTARLWSLASGKTEAVLSGHQDEVYCVAWSPDGKTVATGGFDQSVRLWEANGKLRKTVARLGNLVSSVQFTPDSHRLLVTRGGGLGTFTCSLLDAANGKEKLHFTQHNNTVSHGMLSPDGSLAATAGGNSEETYVWKTADAATVCRLASRGSVILGAGWSQDGSSIAWRDTNAPSGPKGAALQRSFRLTDLAFGPLPDATFRRAQASRGGLALQPNGPSTLTIKRGSTAVTDLKLNEKDGDRVLCSTWLSDNRAVVGGLGLYLFDSSTGKLVRTFQGHTGQIADVAPSPDNRYLLSASHDQTLRIWDPSRDEPLLSFFVARDDWIIWTPEGYYAASPGGEKLMGWHVNQGREQLARFHPAAAFHKQLYRPDVIRRVLTAGSVERALEEADKERNQVTERVKVEEVLPPTVVLTAPERSGLEVNKAELEVRAVAHSGSRHPVTTLRLLLDGRPFEGQKGIKNILRDKPDQPQGEVRESWAVTLTPGKHRLAVQAESAASKAVSDECEVSYAPAQAAAVELPALYVLAVGISSYPGKLKLDCAARDARDLAQVWQTKSGPLFRKVEVQVLTDDKATRADILNGLGWLRKQMTQRDVGIVSFSGHGDRDSDGTFYLAPVDVIPGNLLASGVPGDQLKKTLAGLPGRLLLFLDACHAGSVDGDRRSKAIGGLTDDLVRDLVTDDYGVVVLCSSTGQEFSLEDSKVGHGFFTQALLEGLAGKADYNKDGVIHLSELDLYVTERVKELSEGKQHPVTAKPTSIRSFPLSKP